MRKTTKAAWMLIERAHRALENYEMAISILREYPEVPLKPLDWYNGYIEGVMENTIALLIQMGCYYGFYYVDENGCALHNLIHPGFRIEKHPSYRKFRISFYTKG